AVAHAPRQDGSVGAGGGVHAHHLAGQEEAPEVDLVRAKLVEHAPAGRGVVAPRRGAFGRAPGVARGDRVKRRHVPYTARGAEVADRTVEPVPAVDEPDGGEAAPRGG